MSTEQALLDRVAGCLAGERDGLVADLVRAARSRIDALDHDAASRALLEASVTENVVTALRFLRRGTDVEHLDAPAAALAYARAMARRDVPLSALIRAYRIGHAEFLDRAFTHLADLPAENRVTLVMTLVRRSGQFIDQVCEQVGRTYEDERERWVASQSGVRQEWVNELLRGGAVDGAAAQRALRYPLDAVHVACTLWPAGDMTSFDLVSAVEEVRSHAVAVLGARAWLIVPADEREARLWLALPHGRAAARQALVPFPGACLHAAVGGPSAGLRGFRTSAHQAAQVREIMAARLGRTPAQPAGTRCPPDAQWVHYDDVAPVALMAGDLDALREFTVTTLGRLARAGARNAMLRETLRTFLACHRSHAATAEAMHLHRNSILYRIRQATELLPAGEHSLRDDFNVRTVLLAAHWLGDAVLG